MAALDRPEKIAFLLEDFAVPSPGQQLLDRFLIGYPRDGQFHRAGVKVSVHVASGGGKEFLERRVKDHGLMVAAGAQDALAGAGAAVAAGRDLVSPPSAELLEKALAALPAGGSLFVLGLLAASRDGAKRLAEMAGTHGVSLSTGTALCVAGWLPEEYLALGPAVREALLVTQGPSSLAVLEGLDALLPVIERRPGGETGVSSVLFLKDAPLWKAMDEGLWSRDLLAAALSRSDNILGDTDKDGRTQDVLGLGLVPGLAREPRGFLIEHRDGARSAIVALDGVLRDMNYAARQSGTMVSFQVFRPPQPAEHGYDRLAQALEGAFREGRPPWPTARCVLVAGLSDAFRRAAARAGERIETPELAG